MPVKELQSGFRLPVLGLGTWLMGGAKEADSSRDPDWITAIRRALASGISHIDTAEKYGGGHTEELVGQAIRGYPRQKLFITSKVSQTHLSHQEVIKAAEGSLQRLKTDYLDLYLIHVPNPQVPIEETMAALDELVKNRQGIKPWG